MATTASPPPGAVRPNASADLFTTTPSQAHPAPLRYAAFDNDHFSVYSTNSPSAARRALEAHLKDTDRRIQDASRLGTTLVQQRRDLAARLVEVEQIQQDSEMPTELRDKLTELEREYNEVGQESARAFLPKSRVVSEPGQDASVVITGSGRESPTKIAAPSTSRRQRNQPSTRVHDIEFAAEISTSLLAQVRQLQAALAVKDDELKDATAARAQLGAEATSLVQRLRHMDENEQKYKDENWNLETRLQEMETTLKQSTDKESRMAVALKSAQTEKATKERELDDLKVMHDRLSDDHAMTKKVQEADLHGLRRDAASYETEKANLQKKIEELVMQNTELAKAVSYRFSQAPQQSDTDFVSAEEGVHSDDQIPYHSEANSPVKGTPARHGVLESETLKSSLNHAHRMIQNLKNTIHREKTEKIELKRMLQDARDELETRRDTAGVIANSAKKRRAEPEGVKFKKPANIGRLGAARSSTTEIIDEPDWEDQDVESTPSKSHHSSMAGAGAAYGRPEDDTTDAFETANERDTTTESEAFATGNEDFDEDTEGDATETESGANRGVRSINRISSNPKDRGSFMSTASTSGDEDDDIIRTPVHNAQPRYKLRLSRGARRSGRVNDLVSASPNFESNHSPSSSTGTPQPAQMQSLGDELDALEQDSMEGTPNSHVMLDEDSSESTPATRRHLSLEPESPLMLKNESIVGDSNARAKEVSWAGRSSNNIGHIGDHPGSTVLAPAPILRMASMVDASVMTEPWQPERIIEERIVEKIVEVEAVPKTSEILEDVPIAAGGIATGIGLSKATDHGGDTIREDVLGSKPVSIDAGTDAFPAPVPEHAEPKQPQLRNSPILYQDMEPLLPPIRTFVEKGHDAWALDRQDTQPLIVESSEAVQDGANVKEPEAAAATLAFSTVVAQDIVPVLPSLTISTDASADRGKLGYAGPEGPQSQSEVSLSSDEIKSNQETIPGTNAAKVGAGFFTANPEATLIQNQPNPSPSERDSDTPLDRHQSISSQSSYFVHAITSDASSFVQSKEPADSQTSRLALADIYPNATLGKAVMDEGSQTLVSGEDIDSMLRNKNPVSVTNDSSRRDIGSSPILVSAFAGSPNGKRDVRLSGGQPMIYESPTLRPTPRPTSAGSVRGRGVDGAPPLPSDHTKKIAAAQKAPGSSSGQSAKGNMGPPLLPASAYRARPRTPNEHPSQERRMSREPTTPRTVRARDSRTHLHIDRVSHRSSVSSFASELDERFNITRGHIMYPNDVDPATDPRMIQAITQTMIGEYLWKYTRKAGRSETSSSRHRRFFWVHPYTRTLYWSEQDPSTAGKTMLKAKSVAIEAVRVVGDDNAYPPGLHRKSLVVVTPGREIVFTAPTGQRHETWFNALSYLLLRTEQQKLEAEDVFDQNDVDEFNPGGNTSKTFNRISGRSQSRQSRQSRASLSSYNSRTTRNSSPQRQESDKAAHSQQGTGTVTQRSMQQLAANDVQNATIRSGSRTQSGSMAGRFSSITSRFRTSGDQHARSRTSLRQPDDPAQIYDASVVGDSAEDLRAVIEQQERAADRLENVRACCDGKHDVGSLSRNHRHTSFGNRFGSHGHHSHSHPHRS